MECRNITNSIHHQYLCRILQKTCEDVNRIKDLDNQSYNNLITTGLRLVVKEKLELLSARRKNRETLSNMVSV